MMTSLFLLLPYSVQLEVSGEGHKDVDRKEIVVDWVDNERVPCPDCPCNHQEIIIADSYTTQSHPKPNLLQISIYRIALIFRRSKFSRIAALKCTYFVEQIS